MIPICRRDLLAGASSLAIAHAQEPDAPRNQECQFYDVPHQFNAEMQAYAWKFLAKHLAGGKSESKRPA